MKSCSAPKGIRAVAIKNRDDTKEVARVTAAYAKTGQGRQADADRAATELARREFDVMQSESQVLTASAGLVPFAESRSGLPAAPDRPHGGSFDDRGRRDSDERADRRGVAASSRAQGAAGDNSPGFSRPPRCPSPAFYAERADRLQRWHIRRGKRAESAGMGNFQGRSDFDAVAYWTLQNLGVGNVALIREAQSHVRSENYQMTRVLDQVRDEVAEAYARRMPVGCRLASAKRPCGPPKRHFEKTCSGSEGRKDLPIEVLDSVRLLGQGRNEYLNAIVDYNRAELELYVALGQPPANVLARPAPTPSETIQPPVPEPPQAPAEK